jgi:cation diffusion facilitator family transporter
MARPRGARDPHEHAHEHQREHEHEHEARSAGEFSAQEARQARRLGVVIGIVAAFFVLELGGALVAESVVLQAEALHLLMDVLALGMSLFAMRLAVRRPTPRFTFGLRRAEPVAAIFSATLVLATTVLIVAEAIDALRGRAPPKAGIMLAVATAALFVNGLSAWLLHDVIGHPRPHPHDPDNPEDREAAGPVAQAVRGVPDGPATPAGEVPPAAPAAPAVAQPHGHPHAHGHALNLRGAWLHLLGDALGAVAALVAALVIRFGGSPLADPIASFAVAAILVFGALRLLRDAALVLLEAAPPHLPVSTIRAVIAGSPGVLEVHDLHVWTLGAGHDAVTAHIRTDSRDPAFGQRLSERVRAALGAEYVTLQVECVGEEP